MRLNPVVHYPGRSFSCQSARQDDSAPGHGFDIIAIAWPLGADTLSADKNRSDPGEARAIRKRVGDTKSFGKASEPGIRSRRPAAGIANTETTQKSIEGRKLARNGAGAIKVDTKAHRAGESGAGHDIEAHLPARRPQGDMFMAPSIDGDDIWHVGQIEEAVPVGASGHRQHRRIDGRAPDDARSIKVSARILRESVAPSD